MQEQVTIRYSCELCGLKDREVSVPARSGEDILDWMKGVCEVALVADHDETSPDCCPASFQNVMIPISGDTIGGAVRH